MELEPTAVATAASTSARVAIERPRVRVRARENENVVLGRGATGCCMTRMYHGATGDCACELSVARKL